MEAADGAARAQKRAQQRDLVRRGYDAISLAYRGDRDDPGRYRGWVAELAGLFLAIVGAEPCSGTDRFFGADMFWEHAGTASYLD
jgi:hypothetical protein